MLFIVLVEFSGVVCDEWLATMDAYIDMDDIM